MRLSELVEKIKKTGFFDIEETGDFRVAIVETPEPRKPPKTTYKIIDIRKFDDASKSHDPNDFLASCVYLTILSRPRPTIVEIIGAIQENKKELLDFGFIDDLVQLDDEELKGVEKMKLSELKERIKDVNRDNPFEKGKFSIQEYITLRPKCRLFLVNNSVWVSVEKEEDSDKISDTTIMNAIQSEKKKLMSEGFIDDLEQESESVKVGEVHTLELRTDGKSTKLEDIAIKKPINSIAFQETLKPLATPTEKTENEPLSHDVVNNPNHYKRGDIECFDALKASMTKEQLLGHLKATAISYLWRYDLKNGVEDVKKAKWYVDRMVKELENE